jgi:lysophospholipase L1-like esterase
MSDRSAHRRALKEAIYPLAQATLCGSASQAEAERLESLLDDNPEARRLYIEFICDTCNLRLYSETAVTAAASRTKLARPSPAIELSTPRAVASRYSPVLGFLRTALHGGRQAMARHYAAIVLLVTLTIVPLAIWRLRALAPPVAQGTPRINAGSGLPADPRSDEQVSRRSAQSMLPKSEFPNAPSFPPEMDGADGQTNRPMLDAAADQEGKPWCYLAKSTTVIGVPDQPDVTQITYDGALFTRNAELCFFYGDKDRPLLARQKQWLDGWIPVVQYAWRDGDIDYDIEMFAAPLAGENADNTVNFVQLRMRNTGKQRVAGRFAAALRHSGGDSRFGGSPFSPQWQYEMTDGLARRDGKLVYTFAGGPDREAVPSVAYEKSFAGSQYSITPRAECCLARYRKELRPGEEYAATFKMPRVPVAEEKFNAKVLAADYRLYRGSTIAYWKKLFAGAATIELPEQRVQEAQRASIVHVLLATRKLGDSWTQTDGLPYPEFFITSAPQMVLAYLQVGQIERAKAISESVLRWQQPNGLYVDYWISQTPGVPSGHGHGMSVLAMTSLYSQDRAFAEKAYPSLKKSVQYIADITAKDPYGLLPPAFPYDNEMINGHYTSNNLWASLGLRSAIRVARMLGKDNDVQEWSKLERRYAANILKGIDASAKPDGYVPPGLYKYLTGAAARAGFAEWLTNQDWENMLLAFPGELLLPADPRVRGTVDHVRKNYAEGVMPYRVYMHQYITANQVEQYLALGDNYTALKDFYHLLLHCGSTSEGFENLVRPWAGRQVEDSCPPPHAWASSKLACLIRDLLVMEYGGKAGIEPNERELWLFHCLSPAWTKPGERIAIANAATEFGLVDASMRFDDGGATVHVAGKFHDQPAAYRLRVPYFKELTNVTSDAKKCRRDGDWIILSADATTARLQWRDKPAAHLHTTEKLLVDYRSANRNLGPDANGYAIIERGKPFLDNDEKSEKPQPLSFETVRKAYQHEYVRLGELSEKHVAVEAPAMLGGDQRRHDFARQFGSVHKNVTTGCKVEASSFEPGYPPENAVDGVVSTESSWWAPAAPQWLKVDLGRAVKLKGVQVWPYWGEGRYYQYCVEISTDGKNWILVGDLSKNTTPSTPDGEKFLFAACDVRFIRVRMLYHSLNPSVHLVEVMGIEAETASSPPAVAGPMRGDADYPLAIPSPRHEQKVAAVKSGKYDLVLIGDSITHTLQDFGGKYDSLNTVWKKYYAPRHALNLGHNGFRTENILWNLEHGELDFAVSPKVFVVLIGTNNADSRNFPKAHSAEEIVNGTRAIIELIKKRHPTSKVLVMRIFPKGLDAQRKEGTSPPIFSFSQSDVETARRAGELTAKLADNNQVYWLDVNHVFLRPDGTINTDVMPDLLHPNAAGAEAWSRAIEPTLSRLLGEELKTGQRPPENASEHR